MRSIVLFAVIFAVCTATMAYASDWAQFLGPTANSISPEKIANKGWNTKPLKMLWKIKMSDDGYAGPSVAGGKVFIVDHVGAQDIVKALDITTGKEVWKFAYPDAEKPNYGFARSTPVINSGRVYIASRFGEIFCLNVTNGKRIWMRDTLTDFGGKMPTWQYAASPLIDGNKLIFCPGGNNAHMIALDKTTGKTLWQGGGSDLASYATPVIATINGQKQYVV
ncbi:MAG: outer membrane protein assembly factor BamB family protein, partial [Armatimonadota bacterium]